MNQISKKYVLFEIDKGTDLQTKDFWQDKDTIWKTTYANVETTTSFSYGFGAWGYFDYMSGGVETLPADLEGRTPIVDVSSMYVDQDSIIRRLSYSDMASVPGSFYFDKATQVLYVNFESGAPYNHKKITIGIKKGYANFAGMYNDIYYEGRLKSAPSFSISRDNQFYGIVTYDQGSVSLNNIDGTFDNFKAEDIFGATVRVLASETDVYEDFKTIFSGYLEDYQLSTNTLLINMRDIRKSLELKVPINIYKSSSYPNLNEQELNKPIPIAYGVINKAKALCLDESQVTTFTFKVADTSLHKIKSIDTVYVENKSVTFSGVDLNNATFQLASSAFQKGQSVTVDFQGYVDDSNNLIENPLQIIEELIELGLDIEYSDIYFDTVAWDAIKASSLPKVNIFLNQSTTLIEVINLISNSIFGVFLITQDGRFTYKIQNLEAATKKIIKVSELLAPPVLTYDSANYVSSVSVNYSPRYETGYYKRYNNTTKELELIQKYRKNINKEFNTQLTLEADAQAYSDVVLAEYGGIIPEYEFETKIYNSDIEILDIVEVELYQFVDKTYGRVKVLINSIDFDYNTNRIKFTGRWVSDVTANIDLAKFLKWTPGTSYLAGAVVSSDGQLWRAIVPSVDNRPGPNSNFWDEFGKLYWEDFVPYNIGDIVVHEGLIYQSLTNNLAKEPGLTADWYQGIKDFKTNSLTITNSDNNSQISWNTIDETLDVTLKNGVTGQMFQETHIHVHALENISNGDVVQFAGSDGNIIECVKANVSIASPVTGWYAPETTLGVATQNIAAGSHGYVTNFGRVRGLNTSSWAVGSALFLDQNNPGKMVSTLPTAGLKWVNLGVVEKQHATEGVIFVRPSWGDRFEEVKKDPTGFDNPANVIVTYNSASRTVTLTGTFSAYWRGNLVRDLYSGWTSAPHPAGITQAYFLHYDGPQTGFVWSSTPWTFDQIQICYVAADATGVKFALRECHGLMPWEVHEELHETIGTYLYAGGSIYNYTIGSTTLRNPSVAVTEIKDEDNISTLPSHTTGNNYTLAYLTGAGIVNFTTGSANIVSALANNPYYNNYNGSTWGQTLVANNGYMSVWLIAFPATSDSMSQNYRYVWLQGQSSDGLAGQQALTPANLSLGNLSGLADEFVFIGQVILRYQASNWSISEVRAIKGTRFSQTVVGGGGGGLSTVLTDTTLSGDGLSFPLHVVDDGHEHTSATITDATSVNTADTIVKRDASGNFSAGTITANLTGNSSTATKLATPRTIGISGKVTGTATSFDGSGNITINTTAASVTSAEVTDATSANTANMIVKRDASGNFSAGTITATLSGSATKLTTPRTIGGIAFDGSSNINLPGVNIAGNQDTSGNSATSTNSLNATEWDGSAKTISNSEPSGGADGDIWFRTGSFPVVGGGSEWDSTYPYELGDVIYYSGAWYTSLADNNTGNTPSSTPASWTKITNFDVNSSTATKLETPRTIGGIAFDGSSNINLPGVNIAGNQNTSGNSATATKLATPRTIGGVSFDGTANINLPGVNTSGNQDTSGKAATATKLATPRTIAISGKVTGTATSFDGSGNITIATTAASITSAEVSDATSSNTASTIVKRDASGNFSAGTITANLTGTASLSTQSSNSTEWDGSTKTISNSKPSGGADGDIWFRTGSFPIVGGGSEWDSTYPYELGDVIYYSGAWYTSLADNNTNNIPSSTPASWTKITDFDVNSSTASYAGYSTFLSSDDGYRDLTGIKPNTWGNRIRFTFANAGATGTGGNYSGVMTFAPWAGTTVNGGDASYQLAFGSTAANGGGAPQLRIRKGIDTTWNSWYDIPTTANIGSWAVPLRDRTNWNDSTVINNVVGNLSWKNYGNNHVIFDASRSTSPSGTAINNTNAEYAWIPTYPTLMGWNGSYTFGVRVDSARAANTLATPRTIGISGKVTGTATSFDGSGNITINTTSASITSAEVSDATSSNTANTIVKRNASGYFESGKIVAFAAGNGTKNDSTATVELYDVGGPALSFHRPGVYASKIWFGTDNKFHFGGWSDAADAGQIVAGNITSTGSVSASTMSATTYTGQLVATDNTWEKALLGSGASRADDASGSTWIFADQKGTAAHKWGIFHSQPDNKIQIWGANAVKFDFDQSSGGLSAAGEISSRRFKVETGTAGYFGGIAASWDGNSNYPTLYSDAADRWTMLINPHISYTQNGVNGFTGFMTGSTIRMASDTGATYYWDIGVGTSGVGTDKFSIGREFVSFVSVSNTGVLTANYGIAGALTGTATNATEWDGSAKTISASAPSGGSDGDIWFQTGAQSYFCNATLTNFSSKAIGNLVLSTTTVASGISYNNTTGDFTIPAAGTYKIEVSGSLSGAGTSSYVTIQIRQNAVASPVNNLSVNAAASTSSKYSFCLQGLVACAASDTLKVYISYAGAAGLTTLTYENVSCTITRIA